MFLFFPAFEVIVCGISEEKQTFCDGKKIKPSNMRKKVCRMFEVCFGN
jgi:hypothetical protein